MDINDLKNQIDMMWDFSHPVVNVYFNYSDYSALINGESSYNLNSNPNYFPIVTSNGHQVYVNYEIPDYTDSDYHYFFKKNFYVTVGSWGKCIGIIDDGPKLISYSNAVHCFSSDALIEYNRKKALDTYCSHYDKKAVWLCVSAFWVCCKCKKDLGSLTESEMEQERKKIRMR